MNLHCPDCHAVLKFGDATRHICKDGVEVGDWPPKKEATISVPVKDLEVILCSKKFSGKAVTAALRRLRVATGIGRNKP